MYDAEMAGLQAAAEEAFKYTTDPKTTQKPSKIIFYADNSAAIRKIFEGAQGKAQSHSREFRRHPGCHQLVPRTPRHKEADGLAKSSSHQRPQNPNFKSQAYIHTLCKRELLEAWRFRWTNTLNPQHSGFHQVNRIPLSLIPTERFQRTDRKTFSRLVQCHTGHAHITRSLSILRMLNAHAG